MKKLFLIFVLALMSGCALFTPKAPAGPTAEETLKAGVLDGFMAAAKAPLFKLTCPPAGCMLGSLEIGNPYGASQLAETVKVVMTPQPSTGEKIGLALVNRGFDAVTFGLGANAVKGVMSSLFTSQTAVATGGFNALQGTAASGFSVNGQIASNIPQPGAVTNNTIGGQGVIGSGQLTTNDRHDVTTTNSNNTNPSPKVCTVTATGVSTCTGGT